MHHSFYQKTSVLLASSLISLSINADTQEQLFDLSLQELMSISVASKRSEAPSQAPGIVSIITREHIESYGGLNLGDLIDRLTNTQVMGSSLYPNNRTSLRAVTQTHIDDKVLILLDGRPIRDAGQGGVNGDLYATFPIEAIEQVEVIRGPGSVLYGTNAFAGVLNIVTRSNADPSSSAQIRAGTSGDSKVWAATHQPYEHGSISLNTQVINHDGDAYSNISGELGSPGEHDMGYDSKLLNIKADYKSIKLSSLISNTKIDSANNLQSYPSEDWGIKRRFLDIGGKYSPSKNTSMQLNLTINNMENKAFILSQSVGTPESFFITDSTSYLIDGFIQSDINHSTSLTIGSSYDQLKGDNISAGTLNTEINTWRYTFYSQINHKLSESGRLIGGAQYNRTKEEHSGFSPRLMYIHSIDQQQTVKVGYDEAYRSPFGLDLFLNASFLQGNSDLEPETISTWSAQYSYSTLNLLVTGTLYSSHHENLIVRDESQSPVMLKNDDSWDYMGAEFEHRWKLNNQLSWEGNISYQSNETDTGEENVGIAPNWMIKQGINTNWEGTTLGAYISYFGAPTDPEELNPSVTIANQDPSSYTLATLHIKQSLSSWIQSKAWYLSLYIDNAFDEKAYYPEIARKQVNSFPHTERRAFYLMLDYAP